MKLYTLLRPAGLSLADTVPALADLGVDRCRTTVRNWVQKADLQPTEGHNPDRAAVDETVIRVSDQRYWLYAAVAPAINCLLHDRLFPTRTQALTETFLSEPYEKQLVDDTICLIDGAPWLQAACHRHRLRFRHVTRGDRNVVERVCKEVNGGIC